MTPMPLTRAAHDLEILRQQRADLVAACIVQDVDAIIEAIEQLHARLLTLLDADETQKKESA